MNTNPRRLFSGLALLLIVALSLPSSLRAADNRMITETDLFKFVWIADAQISPDGSRVVFVRVFVNQKADRYDTALWIVPTNGGPNGEKPRQLTAGPRDGNPRWSPDGKTLAFCGERNGEFDIYTIPAAGGEETRLTTAKGLDDGPDYSADGRFIYFNSERSGAMQVWRMGTDGSHQEQVTSDEFNNWFPHPSPDGKWLVFLSYEKDVQGHPQNKDVTLRLMPLGGGSIEVLAKLFGGQGTINVPSWSPDSRRIAFVSYQLVP